MNAGLVDSGQSFSFNPQEFFKRPLTILRLLAILFSIIVFACIIHGGYESSVDHYAYCLYAGDSNACGYGTWIGIIAFMFSVGFLLVDAILINFFDANLRKLVALVDLAFSGFWTFLWFVGFCYLTDKWRNTSEIILHQLDIGSKRDNVQGAIAFSFFSIPVWCGITYFCFRKYQDTLLYTPDDDDVPGHVVPGAMSDDPFPPVDPQAPKSGYQQQTNTSPSIY